MGQQGRTITGLQQQGWQAEAQPQHLLDPSVLQPWNRSYMSACAAVVRPKVTTTALHNLNHFMTQSLLPLGFTSWVVCIGARGRQTLFRRHCQHLVRQELAARDARRVSPRSPDRGRTRSDDKTFLTTRRSRLGRCPSFGTGSLPMPSFQAIREVAPSRSVCEGLIQSIGGIRTTA